VKTAPKRTGWVLPYATYASGALTSSVAVGAAFGLLGQVTIAGQLPVGGILGTSGLCLAICDLNLFGAKTPSLRRQTCPVWWRRWGGPPAAALWGLDLGLGFSTIRITSAWWLVGLASILLATPWMGALTLGMYGLGLAVNLALGLLIFGPGEHRPAARIATSLQAPIRRALAVCLLCLSALLLLM
jgi:hypothetical protein